MPLPPRTLLPLAAIALVGLVALGISAANRSNARGSLPELREQAVTVPATDGFPLPIRLIEPQGGADRRAAVLAGIPADGTRFELARALARRGYAVAVVDLRGFGAARSVNGTGVPLPDASTRWAGDLADAATWLTGLPNVEPERPVVVGLRAAAGAVLEAKGTGTRFGAAALILPTVPPESNPVGAPAYRTAPTGVAVVTAGPFHLPEAVQAFLQQPTRTVQSAHATVGALTQDASILDAVETWLRSPGNGA